MTRDEQEACELFFERYRVPRNELHRAIERTVIGTDWGANGYTTKSDADALADLLRLDEGMTLLDLGAGRGWPGLYFAATAGCRVIAVDLPWDGLAEARHRALQEGLNDRYLVAAASAAAPPVPAGSVDAIVASDVFC